MRKELELIEKIENYLLGKMDPKEKAEFENEIQNNPDLAQKVNAQSKIVDAMQNMALRGKVKKGRNQYKLKKIGVKVLIGLGIAGAITTGLLLMNNQVEEPNNQEIQKSNYQNVLIEADGGEFETELENQIFIIDNTKDTVVETEDGMVIYIPENTFDVNGQYELLIKEAIQADDIMKAGLETFDQDGNLLETGGMFRIEGIKDNKLLSINKGKEFTINVPTINKKGGMSLYDGVRNKEGNIEWNNPREIENVLTPVDIMTLDFYPPNYEDSLNAWGKSAEKKYRDSLYYSYAGWCNRLENEADEIEIVSPAPVMLAASYPQDAMYDTIAVEAEVVGDRCCILEPSKIKAIWNKKFNRTNIATKEFEERVQILHKWACSGEEFFDLYIQNLDQPLWYTDSIIWSTIGNVEPPQYIKKACDWNRFKEIHDRRDGKVKLNSKAQQKLQAYFEKKSATYQEEVKEIRSNYYKKHQELREQFRNAQNKNEQENAAQLIQQMEQETQYMLRNIKQAPPQSYTVSVPSPGWKNIDQKVREKVWARESGTVTDGYNTVTLSFSNQTFTINDRENFDRVKFYLLPQEINSYIRVKEAESKWSYKTNDDMKYDLVIIAYDDQGNIYSHQEKVVREGKNISLKNDDIKNLRRKLNHSDIKNEVDFIKTDLVNMKQERKFKDDAMFRVKVEEVIFCDCTEPRKSLAVAMDLKDEEKLWDGE